MSDGAGVCSVPAEYVEILRVMAMDPNAIEQIREALADLGDAQLRNAVLPIPERWGSDDYELFCVDRRVRLAEYERRRALAIDEWDADAGGRTIEGLTPHELSRVEDWTRTQFLAELSAWLRLHPGTRYETD
ncbi:hypothetical protein [Gordonia sp. SL306]|uniref:hypothetical protein n=1 Tax=Gordonia sp. SL306 TaxID=2995145 RepID=UPI00226FE098|nr:hypothetical protein [Gordonia sp. SL306]WAC56046.1 hypothetical protein OVA31_01905 [Gordonia sp. SL306]